MSSTGYLFAQPFFEELLGHSHENYHEYRKGHDLSKDRKSNHDRRMRPILAPINGVANNITNSADGTVKIEEEVPGFSKENVTITVKEGCLLVSLKSESRKEKRFTYHISSKVDVAKITASCKDGILTMLLPPITKKQTEPLTITVS